MPLSAPQKPDREENLWRQIGRYSQMALLLPASAVAGLILGAALDRWLKTNWITVAGLLLGCIAGFVELIREIIRSTKES
jgi:F0F1-type ATP synthase assembly protein I